MKSILLLLLANLSLQSGAVIAKALFPIIGALQVSILRLLIAAILLTVIQKPWRLPFRRLNWLAISFYGLSLAGMNVLFYQAISRIPLGIAVAIEFIGPLSVAIFQSRGWRNFTWILFATVGLCIFSSDAILQLGSNLGPSLRLILGLGKDAATTATLDPIGLLLALISGVCWGAYIVAGKFASQINGPTRNEPHTQDSPRAPEDPAMPDERDPQGVAAIGMTIGAVLVSPFSLSPLHIFERLAAAQIRLNFESISLGSRCSVGMLLLGLGIFSSALPYSFEMRALRSLSPANFGILMSLQPAVAGLIGFFTLNESLSFWQWFAVGLILIASIGVTITSPRRDKSAAIPAARLP